MTSRIAGEVQDFDASHVLDRKELRRTDRYIMFGLVAAREAMDSAGLPERLEGTLAEDTGVILGTGLGGVGTLTDNITINAERGPDRISPFFIPMGIPNVGAGQIAINSGALGPNFAIVSACATGGHAIGEAWETIRRRDAEVMLAGGTEAGIYEPLVGGFCAMRALSTGTTTRRAPRGRSTGAATGSSPARAPASSSSRSSSTPWPAARSRSPRSSATARRPTPPHHAAGPRRDRGRAGGRRALEKAGLAPDDIDHVNAHATSTPEGDKAELQAIRTIFGEHAPAVPITANKSMIGHTLGAAGAIEAIVTIMTMREGCIPPTINLEDPDDYAEGLDIVTGKARSTKVDIALSTSFGFGGPEQRPRLPAVGRMTEPTEPLEPDPAPRAGGPTAGRPSGDTSPAGGVGSPLLARLGDGDASLLALIDRLAVLLERSDLAELEVEAGATGLILRKPSALVGRSVAVAP